MIRYYSVCIERQDTLEPWIRVYAPDGSLTCETFNTRLADMTSCSLPRSGTYTILASDSSPARMETGSYTLYLQRLNNPGLTTSISFGQTLLATISSATEIDTYTFMSQVDDHVLVRMTKTSNTLQPWIRLYAPDGSLTCQAFNGTLAEITNCILPRSGTYTILASDASPDRTETGSYTLYLECLNSPCGAPVIYSNQVYIPMVMK